MPALAHIALANLALTLMAGPAPGPEALKVTFLHSLSTTFGTVPLDGAVLSYDREHREIFASGDGPTRVFNDSGMELFTFEEDPTIGRVLSVATLEGGDLLTLSSVGGRSILVRCSFRGEFVSRLELRNVPEAFANADYRVLRQAGGRFYLADPNGMRVLVLEPDGSHVASWDVAKLLDLKEDQRQDYGIRGFNVDKEGNILFTVQALFRAYVLTPDGSIQGFGTRGGAPGKFNVVTGIARDDAGYYYVADILKSVVIAFDPEFRFVREFGYRGRGPANISAPEDLVAADGRLFVSQHARKGVSVFRIDPP